MKKLFTIAIILFCFSSYGQEVNHKSEITGSSFESNSTEIMTNRVIEAANHYRQYAPIPRFTQFDYAFAANLEEYKKLNTVGILYLTSLNQDEKEYPISRVYLKTKKGDIELAKLTERKIPVDDLIIQKVFGKNRIDYYFIIPYAITQIEGKLMIDWSANRKDFELTTFPSGVKLEFLNSQDLYPDTKKKLDFKALSEFLEREFQVSLDFQKK